LTSWSGSRDSNPRPSAWKIATIESGLDYFKIRFVILAQAYEPIAYTGPGDPLTVNLDGQDEVC